MGKDGERPRAMMQPSAEMMEYIRDAFHAHGFRGLSMGELAAACGYTRRNLYNYFSNKEDAFRELIRHTNAEQGRRGIEAGRARLEQNASALDVVTEILVVRYASVRRRMSLSPHAVEINAEAFRLCHDIMVRSAKVFANALTNVIVDMQKSGKLQLNAGVSAAQLAQLLGDGVRGVNQSLPSIPSEALPARYRLMCQAILFGGATAAAVPAPRKAVRRAK